MRNASRFTTASLAAGAVALAGLLGTANTAAAEAPPIGDKIDAHLGFTLSTDYYFRGVAVENEGAIFQPEAQIGFNIWEGDVMGEDVALRPYIGTWLSIHDGAAPTAVTSAVFQTNYILGTEVDLPWGFDLDLNYTFLTFPGVAGAFDTQEFQAKLGYDAQPLLEMAGLDIEGFGVNMYKFIAFETSGSLFVPRAAGGSRGVYGEFGIHGSYDIHALGEDLPVTAILGSTLGWSYRNYYQGTGVNNRDWGFVTLDLGAKMPLHALIPDEFGAWSIEGGLSLMWIGNAPSALGATTGSGERFKPLWHAKIGVDF